MVIKKIRQHALQSRLYFNVYALIVNAIICLALSFTPFTLKGGYFWQFLAVLTVTNILYSEFVKRGIAPKKIKE